jgi:hypothetical protein
MSGAEVRTRAMKDTLARSFREATGHGNEEGHIGSSSWWAGLAWARGGLYCRVIASGSIRPRGQCQCSIYATTLEKIVTPLTSLSLNAGDIPATYVIFRPQILPTYDYRRHYIEHWTRNLRNGHVISAVVHADREAYLQIVFAKAKGKFGG